MRSDDGFRAWAADNRRLLVRTATLLTAGDQHTAEDVVQTTLTKMYLAWPRLRGVENRSAYARRVLVNAFTDEMRSTRRAREDLRSQLPERAAGPGTAGHGPVSEDTWLLYSALADLPERMRATVVLRYFHDLSVAETARALRCTQGTVKSQTARALDKLKVRLGPVLRTDDRADDHPVMPAVGTTTLLTTPTPTHAGSLS
ncbi:SigE family RNA polymerase sigma factor [Sanguibacter suaedae]|uniref:SigE family RNA polymerase sigma factor n=1 Tax=Sanguibacter suaedae TaxID=2795737 RepID=A0A934M5Z8_9MICO|nr:SigE family RNA polymerase sigma factor [Sanguibacter suaedae]MBI9113682.1 SigE family RNA polymerase sigma factor [Sanguibacter suaedae]